MLKTLIVQFVGSFEGSQFRQGTPGKNYNYLYTGSKDVQAGDHAVVHNGTNFGVVEVLRVKPGIDDKVTKNVIEVITKTDFEAYKQANEGINAHRKVFDQLDHMLAEQSKLQRYEELAKTNPEAQKLLDQIKGFTGSAIEHKPQESLKIPEHVFFNRINRLFYSKVSGVPLSTTFAQQWIERADEFPTS